MPVAIFGIENDGLNLAANLFVLMLVVVWLALIVWTYLDARRRIEDPVLVACATVGVAAFPYIGTVVYAILRPPEFLDDARERELEIQAAELRVRQLAELSCPNCGYPVEKNFLRCPSCQRRLKDPCQSCGKPVDPRWALCPYCETALPGRPASARARRGAPRPRPAGPRAAGAAPASAAAPQGAAGAREGAAAARRTAGRGRSAGAARRAPSTPQPRRRAPVR